MDEPLPQGLHELAQQLEEEYGAEESLPQEVEELLYILRSRGPYLARQRAAKQLGEVGKSSPRIVRALISVYVSVSDPLISKVAAESLRAPVHQQYLQQHPDLMDAARRALQRPHGAQESLPQEDQELLHLLHFGDLAPVRRHAAEQLGSVGTRSPQIVRALVRSSESDPQSEVRRAAAESLRCPVHQEYLQRDPYLAIRARAAEVTSFLPAGRLRYWLLGTIYAPFLVGATYAAFAIDGKWVLWAAAAVWLLGGCVGLYVLNQKGHCEVLEKLLAKLVGPELGGLVLLAAVGPFLLLTALMMRTRKPGYDAEARPEERQEPPDPAEAAAKALQTIPSSSTGSLRTSLEPPLTDQRRGDWLSRLHGALLALFAALSASVFLITMDQLYLTLSAAPGAISLIYLLGLVLVGGVTGACCAYCAPRETTSAAGTIRAALGAAAGIVYAVVNLVRGRIMLSLPGSGWSSGDLEYFFFISLGGNALFGAVAGFVGGALVGLARGKSAAGRTIRVGRWPLVGGLLLIAISVGIWVIIIAATAE